MTHDDCVGNPKAKDGPSTILQIEAAHFTAGVLVRDDRVVEAAPIVGYMHNWSRSRVEDYCSKKSWEVTEVGQ